MEKTNMKMVCQHSGWCWSRLLLITVLFSLARLSNGVDLGFSEEDYTEMENNGQVTIQVTKLQENTEPIVVNIRALTFDEFNNDPNLDLPAEIAAIVGGVDPAELDGSRNDFDNTVQQVTFQPSTGNVDENININLVDDIINEAQEGFYVVIEVVQSGAGDQINFLRNGVALIRINDNDDITLGFNQPMYTAQEATGDFTAVPITIVKESSRVSEQVLTVNLNFVPSGFASATEGDDYSTTQMSVTLNPEDVSVQVNIVIIDDDILETNEEFQAILSIPADPPSGLNPSPTAGTTVIIIIDNEIAIIGFEQASYTFIEGTNTSAEVCFSISSPPIAQIDPEDVFALVTVEVFDDSALEGEDFMRPQNYDPHALLDTNTFRVCRTVDLLNDDLEESTESFIFRLTLSPGEFDSAGAFQNTVPQAEVVILDDDSQVPLEVGPRFGNLLGGTAVHLSGPCFDGFISIICIFDGQQVGNGVVLNNNTAICVSPRFQSVGYKSLDVQIVDNEDGRITYSGSNFFYAVDPRAVDDIILQQDTLLFVQGSSDLFTVEWVPLNLLPLLDPNSYTVNIDLFRLETEEEGWVHFLNIATDTTNSGTADFTVPTSGVTEAEVYSVALRISVGDKEGSFVFDNILEFAEGSVSQWKSDLYYATSLDLLQTCINWFLTEPQDIGQTIVNRVPSCCATEERAAAPNSGFVRDGFDSLIAFFHPGAASCYRQATITSDNMGSGQQCCYDNDGNLLVGPFSGGTVDLVAPTGTLSNLIQHQIVDVIPSIYCCQGNSQTVTCGLYYTSRPSGGAETCEPPQPAFFFGDPHLVTLDGLQYTFNGLGEFVLIEASDGVRGFSLQGRMVQAVDTNGVAVQATAFSAIVARQSDSDTIQFQLLESEIIIDEIDGLVNGEVIDFEGVSIQEFNDVTLTKTDNAISAVFSSGIMIAASVQNGIISLLSVTLPLSYMSQTSGLMGNYNGDTSDDLLPRGESSPISSESSLEEIHNLFGITWIIDAPEDSLFTYRDGEDWSTFYDPMFLPAFEASFSDPALEAEANSVCGDDAACLFDIASTGNVEIGMATMQGSMEIQRLNNISQPVICNPPCVNGVCVANDSCSCSEGFNGSSCEVALTQQCPLPNPCQNGGECNIVGSSTICTCPPEWTGLLCEDPRLFDCPPYCTANFCSQKLNRYALCTIRNPKNDSNCDAPCRISYCHACYYSDKVKPTVPQYCNIHTCPSYPDYESARDRRCLKHWATCAVQKSRPSRPCKIHKRRFTCFEHPCDSIIP